MKKLIGITIFLMITGAVPHFLLNQKKSETTNEITKIITLSPAQTKTLDYLGLGKYIIGISMFDTNPIYQDKTKIQGGVVINEEEILRLDPELIIVGDIKNHEENKYFFEQHNIMTTSMPTKSLDDIGQSLKDLQILFPEHDLSEKIMDYETTLQELRASSPTNRKTMFLVIGTDPIYSISTNTYLHEFFSLIGWDNIIATTASYPILDSEALVSLPEVDLLVFPLRFKEQKDIIIKQFPIRFKDIIIFEEEEWQFPSPYLLDSIKKLRN